MSTAPAVASGNRYSYAHAAVDAHPAPIHQQIKRIVTEIERYARHRNRMIASGQWHPNHGADVLHELRSILGTLKRVEAQQARAGVATP